MTPLYSVPREREPFSVDAVTHLMKMKKEESTWSIDTRESTAEIFYEDSPNDMIKF
jgi:Tfp pilus assembly protein PilP